MESSDEAVESSDEPPTMLDWSAPVESEDVPLVPDDAAADAVVWVVADVVPIDPWAAIAPNARTKVASDAATTRLRIRAMRAARARSLACAICLGERVSSERDCSGRVRSEGGGSDMGRTVGGGCESTLGGPWEIPERRTGRPSVRSRRLLGRFSRRARGRLRRTGGTAAPDPVSARWTGLSDSAKRELRVLTERPPTICRGNDCLAPAPTQEGDP